MVFEGEDVPLEQDILKKKVEFIRTEAEHNARVSEIVRANGFVGGGSTDITFFTVPENKTLFITAVSLGAASDGGGLGGGMQFSIHVGGINNQIIVLRMIDDIAGYSSNAVSFPMPIKVDSGQAVIIRSNNTTDGSADGCIVGWLEDQLISSR